MHPAEALTRLARAARWHRRTLGIAAAVVCLFASLSALTPPDPETANVLVATRALEAGMQLADADLRVVAMPLTMVPDQAIGDPSEAVGRTLTGTLTSGSVLTRASTLSGRDASDGANEQLVPFRVPDAATVALLHVGDRISVVGATVDGAAIDLATDVRIAALPTPASGGSFGGESGALIVVAADPATASRLAAASGQMRMAIILR